jgi:hypothetical protein
VPSTNFTIDDAIQATRQQLQDDAQRRYDDVTILTQYVPRVMQQLYSDRPDLFVGSYAVVNFKPGQMDPLVFDDVGFNSFVEGLVAAIESQSDESVSSGVAGMADQKSERARRQ